MLYLVTFFINIIVSFSLLIYLQIVRVKTQNNKVKLKREFMKEN